MKRTQWIAYDLMGVPMRLELQGSSVMMRYFLVLHFNEVKEPEVLATGENILKKLLYRFSGGGVNTLVLFSDQFSEVEYRHLRRCVKMGFL